MIDPNEQRRGDIEDQLKTKTMMNQKLIGVLRKLADWEHNLTDSQRTEITYNQAKSLMVFETYQSVMLDINSNLQTEREAPVQTTELVSFHTGTSGLENHQKFIDSIDEKGIEIIHSYNLLHSNIPHAIESINYVIKST